MPVNDISPIYLLWLVNGYSPISTQQVATQSFANVESKMIFGH